MVALVVDSTSERNRQEVASDKATFTESMTIPRPKKIEDISTEDLSRHRWCYYHDNEGDFDSFEWVIPDTHPKFDPYLMELELATFRFSGGQEFLGMLDVSQFSVCLGGQWYSFWTGAFEPTEQDTARLKEALHRLGLTLPVEATAKWSGRSACYNGIRYLDEDDNEVEIWIT
jgi:hypothetical protein